MLNRYIFVSSPSLPVRNSYRFFNLLCLIFLIFTGSCTATASHNPLDDYEELTPAVVMDAPSPDPARASAYDPELVARGKYMVELLGCPSCHTDGALAGVPDQRRFLAGSRTGIAYTNPLKQKNPGVLYPANLTPDKETGLGTWTDEGIIQVLRTGIAPDGRHTLSVMPWTSYAGLIDNDARAIVAYLRSLPPVRHAIPENVPPGQKAAEPYVHFGVYQSK